MSRKLGDWIDGFTRYAAFGEAPKRMYFWVAVSTIAGALRRRVWIDQAYFQWYPNLYIVLVAPPGIVSKSTTAEIGMSLLRQVPGVNFGPSVVTWQSLVKSFAEACESFSIGETYYPMSALTIVSSEFGNLVNPKDKDMIDMLVNLWDGRSFTKATKMSGTDEVTNPWINLIACNTPEWIAGNFPEYMIGGGFTSRCIFCYEEAKEKYVAYPGLEVPADLKAQEADLVHDLEHIATRLAGEYKLDSEAVAWGEWWYKYWYEEGCKGLDTVRFGGYIARKQTMIHKLAMVLAAAQRDELVIVEEDLKAANNMLTDLEPAMSKVFDRIGMSDAAFQQERFLKYVQSRGGISQWAAHNYLRKYFPDKQIAGNILESLLMSNQIKFDGVMIRPTWEGTDLPSQAEAP